MGDADDSQSKYHTFAPLRTVAVVGLGASGAPATRHLRDAGLAVTAFERQSVAGGIWNWRPEVGRPLGVPTPPPSRGAFTPVFPSDLRLGEKREIVSEDADGGLGARFSPPNPVYASLSNNVPTSTMVVSETNPAKGGRTAKLTG
jgi:cation diffusion facilitator CzcD-associated flavoprotein CzcO